MTLDRSHDSKDNSEIHTASVLVTGGAGFIGSHLVDALLASDNRVTVIDDMSTGRQSNLQIENDQLTLIHGTVGEQLAFQEPSFDYIFHLAAAVGVKLVVDEPIRTIETNVLETSAILRFAAKNKTPVMLASTSEVYGKSEALPMQEDGNLVFGSTEKSRWSYGCSKALDEHLAMAWYRREDLPVRIPRFFNTIGPRQKGSWGMVVPRFVAAALSGKPLIVYGDGSQTRCFCDVRDMVPMLLDLIKTDDAVGKAVNVGSDTPITILQLAELVKNTLNSNSTIEFKTMNEVYGDGFEDLQDRQPDLTRLHSLIGTRTKFSLQKTITSIAESFVISTGNEQ
ncbi:MAG: GDP-mannose 4,6-dehydratase [Planctomycetes bacterium]|nr:GDP-mannose 4,6-dehydratase [Planctomycetota bacterium]